MGFGGIEEIPYFLNIQDTFKKKTTRSFSDFCFGCWYVKQCFKLWSVFFIHGIYCKELQLCCPLRGKLVLSCVQTAGLELQHLLQSVSSSLSQDV